MENMTKEQAFDYSGWSRDALIYHIMTLENKLASGSVAAAKPKTEGRWFKDWKKITESVIPKGPMCRDCADEDGTCPNNDSLPCDPSDEVIERFKRLRQQLKEREEILKELIEISERYVVNLKAKAIIERARNLISK